jgi:hypothetical protein
MLGCQASLSLACTQCTPTDVLGRPNKGQHLVSSCTCAGMVVFVQQQAAADALVSTADSQGVVRLWHANGLKVHARVAVTSAGFASQPCC